MTISQLLLTNSIKTAYNSLLTTHPPIKKRIQALSGHSFDADTPSTSKISQRFRKDHIAGQKASPSPERVLSGHDALRPEVILGAIVSIGRWALKHDRWVERCVCGAEVLTW